MNKVKKELINDVYDFLGKTDGHWSNGHSSNHLMAELKNQFPKYFKKEKPLNRWYVEEDFPKMLWFFGDGIQYGLDCSGGWVEPITEELEDFDGNDRLATDQEIKDRLSAYANKKYPLGCSIKSIFNDNGKTRPFLPYNKGEEMEWIWDISDNGLRSWSGMLTKESLCLNPLIMKDGVWCEIIKEPKTLTEVIEKYEYNCADEFYVDFIKELKEVTKI